MLYVDPDTCIDCGACVPECPVEAIFTDVELTDESERYVDINARYYLDPAHANYGKAQHDVARPVLQLHTAEPLRVAIVGSGPAGSYAAEELLSRRGLAVQVNMFERLPTPWGLVRSGVAPDHPDTKSVIRQFSRTASRSNLTFYLNVEVGRHITSAELLAHHHAVICAVGAPNDRNLGVSGEDLPGSHAATDFVAWYNGHPDAAGQRFDLSCERAVVVGNGNVALDVSRILASAPDRLATTDIADHALEALAASQVKEVVVLGRRGPEQASFSTSELIALAETAGFDVVVARDEVMGAASYSESMTGLKLELLQELAELEPHGADKRIVFRFLRSPVEILGSERVSSLRVMRNELVTSEDGSIRAKATGETEDIACGLVLRSVGYRGAAFPGLPFDDARGTLPNDQGRVVDPETAAPVVGVYTAGWIKRGPTGVIGTNKKCARDTVQALIDDYAAGRLAAPPHFPAAVRELVYERQPEALGYSGWLAIDRHEVTLGRERGRARTKVVDISEMLRIAANADSRVDLRRYLHSADMSLAWCRTYDLACALNSAKFVNSYQRVRVCRGSESRTSSQTSLKTVARSAGSPASIIDSQCIMAASMMALATRLRIMAWRSVSTPWPRRRSARSRESVCSVLVRSEASRTAFSVRISLRIRSRWDRESGPDISPRACWSMFSRDSNTLSSPCLPSAQRSMAAAYPRSKSAASSLVSK
jgi:ferredoxin--NADP+ reductase